MNNNINKNTNTKNTLHVLDRNVDAIDAETQHALNIARSHALSALNNRHKLRASGLAIAASLLFATLFFVQQYKTNDLASTEISVQDWEVIEDMPVLEDLDILVYDELDESHEG